MDGHFFPPHFLHLYVSKRLGTLRNRKLAGAEQTAGLLFVGTLTDGWQRVIVEIQIDRRNAFLNFYWCSYLFVDNPMAVDIHRTRAQKMGQVVGACRERNPSCP